MLFRFLTLSQVAASAAVLTNQRSVLLRLHQWEGSISQFILSVSLARVTPSERMIFQNISNSPNQTRHHLTKLISNIFHWSLMVSAGWLGSCFSFHILFFLTTTSSSLINLIFLCLGVLIIISHCLNISVSHPHQATNIHEYIWYVVFMNTYEQ